MSKVFLKNTTASAITVAGYTVYYIDGTDAEIVTVYDANDVEYNAFKYYLDSTPYWYVLDGVNTYWTSDLSSIGYSDTPSSMFPTVTEILTLPNNSSGISTIQSGGTATLWKNTPSWARISYDVTSCYAVVFWRKANNTLGGMTEFSTENISDLLAVRNVSSSAIEVYWIKIAVCSSNQATVATVYNSNAAYNAFKYNLDDNDYYYVLDGIQTEWIFEDDLETIGYSNVPTVSETGSATIGAYAITIPDGDGFLTPFSYDSAKIYSVSTGDGSGGVTRCGWTCSNVNNYIYVTNNTGGSVTVYGYSVYECNSLSASIVTVYNASNEEFSAFKYDLEGYDYYYVLDGVQEYWEYQLGSIGYREEYTILLGFKWNADETELEAVTDFGYYWSRVISQTDKDFLNSLGLWVDPGFYKYGCLKFGDSGYSIKLAGVYTGIGEGAVPLDSNWEVRRYTSNGGLVAGLYYEGRYTSTPVTTWKVSIRHVSFHLQGFMNISKRNEYITYGSDKNLRDEEGDYIIGDRSKIYTLVGVYDENHNSVPYTFASVYAYNNRLHLAWNSSPAYVASIDYIEF